MAFFVKMLGCNPDTTNYTVLCILLLMFALREKWPIYCISSNIVFLCVVVRYATCLTGWVDNSRFSVKFIIVGARVVCATVDISGIIFIAFDLMFVRHNVHLNIIKRFQIAKL